MKRNAAAMNNPKTVTGLTWRRLWALLGRGLYTEPPGMRGQKKSIFIRHLDGGSSNVFELELVALTNPVYDLAQYGIHFVASPRHADVLLITGPLTWNMLGPARAAFDAMPEPKRIVTVGDCADFADLGNAGNCLFEDSYATTTLPDDMRKAIVAHVPGDPPSPQAIIEMLLSLKTK